MLHSTENSREKRESVLLVHVDFSTDSMQEDLEEFKRLLSAAGAKILEIITAVRKAPDSRYFVGSGKAKEIQQAVQQFHPDLIAFNHVLSPAQGRNLERLLGCRVIDRTELILDIFAQRARSFEGKLQVELALLKHLSTRLIRGWTHLERQRGGIGLRGPGETQLETDRRLIRTRMRLLTERLARVRGQRELSRHSRRRSAIPTVVLVGYTNAGKSTLFNRLTGADVLVADQLFATLDSTLRRMALPSIGPVVLADTVGFIRHLPHDLVAAFRSTLEEVSEADLLLHVVDVGDTRKQETMREVQDVLESLDAKRVPQIVVFNKIDSLESAQHAFIATQEGDGLRVFVSAQTGAGIDVLFHAIAKALAGTRTERWLVTQPHESKLRAELYAISAVLAEEIDDAGNICLRVNLPDKEWERFHRKRDKKNEE